MDNIFEFNTEVDILKVSILTGSFKGCKLYYNSNLNPCLETSTKTYHNFERFEGYDKERDCIWRIELHKKEIVFLCSEKDTSNSFLQIIWRLYPNKNIEMEQVNRTLTDIIQSENILIFTPDDMYMFTREGVFFENYKMGQFKLHNYFKNDDNKSRAMLKIYKHCPYDENRKQFEIQKSLGKNPIINTTFNYGLNDKFKTLLKV